MRRFILNTFIFFIISIVCIVGLWSILVSQRQKFCSTNATKLICGNSTVEYGIDDNLLPGSLNVGLNAENPEFVYAKIKMIKKYSPSVDTILVCIDDNFISKNTKEGYHSDLHHFYYYDQMDIKDIEYLVSNTSMSWIESFMARPFNPMHVYNILRYSSNNDFKALGVGGYYELDGNHLSPDIKVSENSGSLSGDYDLAKFYIQRIADLCNRNGMKLIFFTTPKFKTAQTYGYRKLLDESFPDFPLLDFTDYPLADSCFFDSYHLNRQGAQIFTQILADSLQNI